MNSICRSCLSEDIPVSQIDDNFRSNYFLLTTIQIKLTDGLPQDRCMNCAEMVANFIEFRAKCMQAENYLQLNFEEKPNIKIEIKDEIFQEDNECNEEFSYSLEIESDNLCNGVKIKEESNDDIDLPLLNRLRTNNVTVKKETCKNITEKTEDTQQKQNNDNKVNVTEKIKNTQKKQNNVNKVISTEKTKHTQNKQNNGNKDFIFDTDVLGCGICHTSFKLDEDEKLKLHLETHIESTECEICLEGFPEWPQLISHRIKHLNKKHRACYICKENIKDVYDMEYHYRQNHTESDKELKCKICFKIYKTAPSLKKHVSRHGTEKECPICKKSFRDLRAHMSIHSEDKTYVCKQCPFSCKTNTALHYHTAKEHVKISCSKCKRFFKSQVRCDKHVCKLSTFFCSICGKVIATNRRGYHMRLHEATPSYKCHLCPAVYREKANLRSHIDKHNKTPRHECEFCKRKFYERNCLKKHLRLHTGEKPHVCQFCNKGFTAKHNLKVHMKVHGFDLVVKKNKPEDVSDE